MSHRSLRPLVASLLLLTGLTSAAPTALAAEGQLTWAVHITLAPTWFDPAETPGLITPYMLLYALHDALVKPMPGQPAAPSLAESWTVSPDGLVYEFVLRKGPRFHNGEPVTAEDVKFSLDLINNPDFRVRNRVGHSLVKDIKVVAPDEIHWRMEAP